MENVVDGIRQSLRDSVDEKTLSTKKNFFKEEIRLYGVKIPLVNKISKEAFDLVKDWKKKDIFLLCEELWKSGYSEESYIACNLSYYIHKNYEPSDFDVFDRWVNLYVTNWASCDTLCNHTVGTFVEMYPEYISKLKEWAKSDNRWVKRAAAVSLIIPARKGLFLKDIFEIADILLLDEDDLVQKGYGWMLKAASDTYRKSETYQKKVFDYVIKHKSVMPRTSLRYAIEKMPQDMRVEAMKK